DPAGRIVIPATDTHHPPDGDHHGGPHFPAGAAAEQPQAGAVAVATRHRHGHRHIGRLPNDPFLDYGRATSFGVGMIHGIGAETPTQVLIFVTAAGAGGKAAGLVLLVAFLVGLLASNTLIALAGTYGFLGETRRFTR